MRELGRACRGRRDLNFRGSMSGPVTTKWPRQVTHREDGHLP